MTDTALLTQIIENSGLKKGFIAEALGITRASLNNLLTGKTEARVSQMRILRTLLSLSDDQFNAVFFTDHGV